MVSNENGYIQKYDNIDGNLGGTFNQVSTNMFSVFEPYQASFDIADLNGDGMDEVITGCYAGGLSIYSKNLPVGIAENIHSEKDITVYPNPAKDYIVFELNKNNSHNGKFQLSDISGKVIMEGPFQNYINTISLQGLNNGIYILQITESNHFSSHKVVKF